VDEILDARQAQQVFTAFSLDAPLSDEDGADALADTLGQEDEAVAHAIDMEAVHTHLDELPEREQRILMLRFYGNLSQAEIAARVGLSQMHVSRLLSRALSYLRIHMTESA
jgi:RNA polymerase sigma-B factor